MSVFNASRKIKILALLSALAIIAISYMKSALELEDAEQAYYSQWWRLTYDDQPPLYTWLQIVINNIFGIQKFSFSLLRALIFSGTIGAVYFFGKEYLKNKKLAAFGVLLLALIPVFIDFTFRRLSHTSLLCLAVLLTFILVHRLITIKSSVTYLMLGLVVSLGTLTKYNYFLMLAAFVLVIPFNNSIRAIIFNKRILLTLGVVIILVFPHFYDLFSSAYFVEELHKSVAVKTSTSLDNAIPVLSSFLAFVKSFFNLILPLFVVLASLFWKKRLIFKRPTSGSWLKQVFVSQLVVLALAFMIMNVVKVETRWLLPLFIPYVILVLSVLQINNLKKYVNIGFCFFPL